MEKIPGSPRNRYSRSGEGAHEHGTRVHQSVCVDETGYITYLRSIQNAHADIYMYSLHSVRTYWLTGWTWSTLRAGYHGSRYWVMKLAARSLLWVLSQCTWWLLRMLVASSHVHQGLHHLHNRCWLLGTWLAASRPWVVVAPPTHPPFTHPSIYNICSSVCPSIHLSNCVCPSVHSSNNPSAGCYIIEHPSAHSFVCPFISLSSLCWFIHPFFHPSPLPSDH